MGTISQRIGGFASRLSHFYYVVNFALLFTYILIRPGVVANPKGKDYEGQMGALIAIALLAKLMKTFTLEHYVDLVFMYGKCALLVLAWVSDTATFIRVALLVAGATILAPLPLSTSLPSTELLTPSLYEESVRKEGRETKQVWLVYVCATWHASCFQRARLFADLASKYAGGKIHFGVLPLDRWPGWGIKNLKMDIMTSWQQLPSIILYENGEEVDRIPRVDPVNGKIAKGRWTADDLEKIFKLQERRAKADESGKKKR